MRCPLESCTHSSAKYKNAKEFDRHLVTKHIIELEFENGKVLYACPICQKRFQKIGPLFRWHLKGMGCYLQLITYNMLKR